MKAKMLKIAGVKTEAQFYKKFPSQEAFMKAHGKEFKKAQMGAIISGGNQTSNPTMINYQDMYDQSDKSVTGMTDTMRLDQASKLAQLKKDSQTSSNSSGGGMGNMIGSLGKLFGGEGGGGMEGMEDVGASLGGAKYGTSISKKQFTKAQFGNQVNPVNQLTSIGSTDNSIGGINAPQVPQSAGMQPYNPSAMDKIGGAIGKYAGPAGKLFEGYQALRGQRRARKEAEQQEAVSDVSLLASQTRPEEIKRKYVRPEDIQNTGEEFFPIYGVGTNPLARNGIRLQDGGGIGGNPTEIQNTYSEGYDIYTDGGYEPLNNPNQVKSFYNGGRLNQMVNGGVAGGGTPWGAISGVATNLGQEAMGGQNAGGQIGGTIGETAGNLIVPGIGGAVGKFVGGIAGNALDTNAKRMKKSQAATQRNITKMGLNSGFQSIQGQNQAYARNGDEISNYEDGGYMNPGYNPQVITMFGDSNSEDFADFANKNQYRAGGHLKSYTPPSDRAMETYEDGGEINSYGLGGELQTHWGGGAETISQNPYLPSTGETVMFRGKSHEEYSPNGETGIGVTYGGNPVEVERGEPMVELEEGGVVDPQTGEVQKSGVVFGNLKIPNQYIDMLGDKNAKGKKFKNYVNDLSKGEERQNKLIEKTTKELNGFTPITPFDKLKMTSLKASIQGANMKLKDFADKKINAASLQNAINDTAEEQGIVADDLARGKVKIDKEAQKQNAKYGGKFKKAQSGINNLSDEELIQQADMQGGELDEVIIQGRPKKFSKPEMYTNIDAPEHINNPYYKYEDDIRPLSNEVLSNMNKKNNQVTEEKEESKFKNPSWMKYVNQILPYLRPSDQEALDMEQLYPEMYAMSSNQLEPVPAQGYQPDLGVPYDVSFQDQLNANQSDYRSAQRMAGYNPAAQANLNAQKYAANQQVLGNQFRANQEMRNKVYGENRNIVNQANVANLGIYDKQYERQSQALSNTKATTQAALNSIADKYAKNKLENRTLGVMENMYNYRFDKSGRAMNMNPLAQFNLEGKAGSSKAKGLAEGKGFTYDENGNIVGVRSIGKEDVAKSGKKISAKNGSIVKSYKNI